MIPLHQTAPLKRAPWVNRGLVVANAIVFAVQLSSGPFGETLIRIFGFIPARFFHPHAFGYNAFEVAVTLFSSLFMHGGLVHLLGNMLYLWVFGAAVEDRVGHRSYLAFYLLAGAMGSLVHAFVFPSSTVPSVGASGSIAGVLGAYLVLHPHGKVVTLLPLVVYWATVEFPAMVFLPVWFVLQFLSGWMAIASARVTQEAAGVAWWAHVGGFLFGAGIALGVRAADRRWSAEC